MKEQSKKWTLPGDFTQRLYPAKKAKTVPSAGKIMATVFWDSQGIIFPDYLEKRRTFTWQYYADLLDRFVAELMKKRPHLAKIKVLFHYDKSIAHSSAIATAKQIKLRYELLPHPPFSPDLVPCDFVFIPNMKNGLEESDSLQTRKSSPQQRPILLSSTNHIF